MPRKRSPATGRNLDADKAGTRLPVAGEALAAVIDRIRYWHRQRCAAMEARKTVDLRLGAHLRMFLGWSRNLPERERKIIAAQAAEMIKTGEGGEWSGFISAFAQAREPFDNIEARAVDEMAQLAALLPAWALFGESIRGFGVGSLAVIVAEAGDLSNYPNPAKLWKRMGLAVMGDVRQGGLAKGASKEDWIAHGYNRQRRSRMWNIGDALIKGNRDGEYRAIYLARKAYELARDPEMKPIKAHRRAQRYMEKRLLRNLWEAWWQAMERLKPILKMPAASSSAQVERSAAARLEPSDHMPSASIPAKAGKRQANVAVKSTTAVPAASSSAQAARSAISPVEPNVVMPSAPIPAEAGERRASKAMVSSTTLPAASSSAQAERSAKYLMEPMEKLPSTSIPAKAGTRRANGHMKSSVALPAASPSAQAERSAIDRVSPTSALPSAAIPHEIGVSETHELFER